MVIIHDGKTVSADFGVPIEIFDLMRTEETGLAEIRLTSPAGTEGILQIKPKTSLSLEPLGSQKGGLRIDLFSGSAGLAIRAVSDSPDWELHAEGVRLRTTASSFDVTTAPAGGVLVICEAGRVTCENGKGIVVFAEPESAVESVPGGALQNIPVRPAEYERLRKSWYQSRSEALGTGGDTIMYDLVSSYTRLKEKFNLAYHDLLVKRYTLDIWFREDSRNTVGGEADILREKKSLEGPLSNLREVLVPLERVYFRLLEFSGQGAAVHERFFRGFENEAPDLLDRMNIARYSLKLYAKRSVND